MTGAQLKAAGVKAGYPDIGLDVARGGYHGLRIELKTITGRLRANQREWLDWLTSQGYLAVACHGMEEAQDTIEDYLRGLLVREKMTCLDSTSRTTKRKQHAGAK